MKLDITPSANEYLCRLLANETDASGVLLSVFDGGQPQAEVNLQFAEPQRLRGNERVLHYSQLTVYVAEGSDQWLDQAEIDYDATSLGQGQLTIKAPFIKGQAPASDAPLVEHVRWVMATEINPYLATHGGFAEVQSVSDHGEVRLTFHGGCRGCGQATVTLQRYITTTLLKSLPSITSVIDITDHASGQTPYFPPSVPANGLP